jgi:hypothetical protein
MSDQLPNMIGDNEPTGEAAAADALEQETGQPIPLTSVEQVAQDMEEATWEELLATALFAWSAIAEKRAPLWAFAPEECEALGRAWAPVLRKYVGNVALDVELAAIVATIPILAPRFLGARKRSSTPPVTDGAGVPMPTGGFDIPASEV